jgi:hypothetical protein
VIPGTRPPVSSAWLRLPHQHFQYRAALVAQGEVAAGALDQATDQRSVAVRPALQGAVIPIPSGVQVWLASGHTDMRDVRHVNDSQAHRFVIRSRHDVTS